MGASSFTEYIKKAARDEAATSGGTTTFMQTGEVEAEALRTIRRIGGAGRYAFVVDVLTLVMREHSRLGRTNLGWMHQRDPVAVARALDHHDAALFGELENRLRAATGTNTLVIFVVDGSLRPAAKQDEMAKRARYRAKKNSGQTPLACGTRKEDLLLLHTRKAWMTSQNPDTIWLAAHDEADVLIAHLISSSHLPGAARSMPAPDHDHFETPEIRHAVSRLTGVAACRRTVVSRDTDLAACNVGTDIGFFLWPDWHGELDHTTLRAGAAAAGPAPVPATSTAAAGPPRGAGLPPAPRIMGQRPVGTVVGAGQAPGPAALAAAAQPRRGRGAKVQKLPLGFGNYVLLLASGLDALAALGGDRPRRVRAWCLAGTDYFRSGIRGVTYKMLASGLLDDLLARPFTPMTLARDLEDVLARLASANEVDRAWRGSGRFGRVRKFDKGEVPADAVDKLVEASRIGNGLVARAYIDADGVYDVLNDLEYGARATPADRDKRTAAEGGAAPAAAHAYFGRPTRQGEERSRPATNPRRANPIQPPRPNEGESTRPAKSRIRPHEPGESLVTASLDYAPEPVDIDAESLRRHREQVAKAEARAAEYAANKAEWDSIREKEQRERAERGDDETEARTGTEKKAGLDTAYEAVMTHAEPISAAFRTFTAEATLPPTATPGEEAVVTGNQRSRHRSGNQQRKAQQGRMTEAPPPPSSSAPPSSRAQGGGEKTTSSSRTPDPPPNGAASVDTLVSLMWLSIQLSTCFVTAAYRALTVARLDRKEAGVRLVSAGAMERNGIAREHGRLALFGDPTYKGEGLANDPVYRGKLEQAGAAARAAGIPTPVKMPMHCYTQAYVPLQTAIKAIPEQWLLADLYALGSFIAADPQANSTHALALVFADAHISFSYSARSATCLAALDSVPDAASRFRSRISDLLGRVIRDAPYSQGTADAGRQAAKGRVLSQAPRSSPRPTTQNKSGATQERLFGISSSVPQQQQAASAGIGAQTAPRTSTVENTIDKEYVSAVEQEVQKLVRALNRANPSSPLPTTATATNLARDFLEVAFRLVCFRNRNVEIALNLSDCPKKAACEGKTLQELLSGRAPVAPEKFSKGLLALTITLRRMLGVHESRILPLFDPSWVSISIDDVVRLSEDSLQGFLTDLDARVTAAVQEILPILNNVDDRGAEVLAFVRQNFDLVREDGQPWPWRDAEQAGAQAGGDTRSLAAVLGAHARLRPHLRARTEAVAPTLRKILGTDGSLANHVAERHARVELMNIVARRAVQAPNMVATGFMQVAAHHVRFYAVKLDSVKGGELNGAAGLDAGLLWSRIAQQDWSVLTLQDYYATLRPAYEVKRATGSGAWTTERVEPIAEPTEAAMNARRQRPSLIPDLRPLPRHDKARRQARMQRAHQRSMQRGHHPSTLRSAIRRAVLPDRTRGGLPISWGRGTTANTQERMDRFAQDREPEQLGYIGIDLGVKRPLSAFVSTPSSHANVLDGRAEASVVYSRNALLTLEQRNSAEMAHMNLNIAQQLDRERFAHFNSTPLRPPNDTLLVDMWLHLLTKAHPVRERVQVRYAVEREAEIQSFVSELGRTIAAGNSRDELVQLKWIVFVGEDMTSSTGQSGAASHNTIMQHLPGELRSRGMDALFVRVPETCTSKRCIHPHCRQAVDSSRRSE
ncbi:hypothetical protein JCM3774_005385 [Rhodotorula dairenensis]